MTRAVISDDTGGLVSTKRPTSPGRAGPRDKRAEPLAAGTPVDAITDYHVDRPFGRARTRPPTGQPAMAGAEATEPTVTITGVGDVEVALRRQLSRLQRQLAEAQRDLANKDDELAQSVENRLVDQAMLVKAQRLAQELQDQLAEARGTAASTQTADAQLRESLAAYDDLAARCDQERDRAAEANARADELGRALEEARQKWTAERAGLEARAASERSDLEASRKAAIVDAENNALGAFTKLKAAHERELAALRASHEAAVTTLRGELEPKLAEVGAALADAQRLGAEIEALRREHARELEDRETTFSRERERTERERATELDEQRRAAAAEIERLTSDRDGRDEAHRHELRAARAAVEKAEQELFEAREKSTRTSTEVAALQSRVKQMAAASEAMVAEQRALTTRVDVAEAEARRSASERARVVALFEEGLSLLGAGPPALTIEAEPAGSGETVQEPLFDDV